MTDLGLDVLNLLDRLLFVQPVDEEIDVRGRCQLLMVVLSERALGFVVRGLNNAVSYMCGAMWPEATS